MTETTVTLAEREALIAEIAAAFADVSLDDGVTLHEARALDDYEDGDQDRRAAREKDRGVRWQDVADETLRDLNDVHSFLDAKGFHFYIPAFMTWILRHVDDESDEYSALSGSTLYSLYPSHALAANRERFAAFTEPQCRAVCRFLRFLARPAWPERCDEEDMLDLYWGQFCPLPPDEDDLTSMRYRSTRRRTGR